MARKYILTWDTFSDHLRSTFIDLHREERLWDVTLVSEDGVQFRAHKIVLRAGSGVLDRSVDTETRRFVTRGIHSQELQSVLQFLYLGQAAIKEDRIEEFLKVSRDLEIKELVDNLEIKREDLEKEADKDHVKNIELVEIK